MTSVENLRPMTESREQQLAVLRAGLPEDMRDKVDLDENGHVVVYEDPDTAPVTPISRPEAPRAPEAVYGYGGLYPVRMTIETQVADHADIQRILAGHQGAQLPPTQAMTPRMSDRPFEGQLQAAEARIRELEARAPDNSGTQSSATETEATTSTQGKAEVDPDEEPKKYKSRKFYFLTAAAIAGVVLSGPAYQAANSKDFGIDDCVEGDLTAMAFCHAEDFGSYFINPGNFLNFSIQEEDSTEKNTDQVAVTDEEISTETPDETTDETITEQDQETQNG